MPAFHARHRLPLAFVMAALLLVAQALGLSHRVHHPGGDATAVQAVWGGEHEAGGAVCQLVDQLAHADALCDGAPAAQAVLAPADAIAARPAHAHARRTATCYLARGPPTA
jgi:hypothetical protein